MKILIICSNLIGDTVLSTGVFSYLSKKYQNADFTFIIGPTAKPLLKNHARIDKIITIKKKKFNIHWISIINSTFYFKWDIVVDLRSSLLSFILNKKKSYIFKRQNGLHHVQQLNKSFGFDCSNLSILTNKDEENEVLKTLDSNKKYFVIFPGGNWKPKIWPVERFNKLIRMIEVNNKNINFIFVGSISEKKLYYNILKENINKDRIIDLFGKSLTLTAAYLKKSNLFIGNDSGLMHLATSCKLTTVALFGPTNDVIYGPWGEKNLVIRTVEKYKYFEKINIDNYKSYMMSIKCEIVYNKLKSQGYCE